MSYFLKLNKTKPQGLSKPTDFSRVSPSSSPLSQTDPCSGANTLRQRRTRRVDQTTLQHAHGDGSMLGAHPTPTCPLPLQQKGNPTSCRREPPAHSCQDKKRSGTQRCKNAIAIQWVINNKIFLLRDHLHPLHPHKSGTFLFQLHTLSLSFRAENSLFFSLAFKS